MNNDRPPDAHNSRLATRNAALEFLREGVFPTPNLIRDRIGFGSLTTISDELKQWRQEILPVMASAASSAPPHWTQERIDLYDGFMRQARALEREAFEQERTELHIAMDGIRNELSAAVDSRDEAFRLAAGERQGRESAERMIESLTNTLEHERLVAAQDRADREQLVADFSDLQVRHEEQAVQHKEATEALRAEHERHIGEINSQHEQAITSLKAEAQSREKLAYDRLDGVRQQLMEETDRQRAEFQTERSRLEHELEKLKQESRQREETYRLRTAAAERAAAEAAGEVKGLQKLIDRLERDAAKVNDQAPIGGSPQPEDPAIRAQEAKAFIARSRQSGTAEFDILTALQDDFALSLDAAQALLSGT